MTRSLLLTSLLLLPLVACGDKDDDTGEDHDHTDDTGDAHFDGDLVAVSFEARFGDQAAACDVDITGVGSTGSTVQLQDLKLYVHDVVLIDGDGGEHPLSLQDDDLWQNDQVALLDFEDGSGLCSNGTGPTNVNVVGYVDDQAAGYEAVRFTIGVPFEYNHDDPAAAESPLNLTTMHWSWQGGYKFVRLDLSTEGLPGGWFFHLGSTGCTADDYGNVTEECANPNRVEVQVDVNPFEAPVVLDFGALLADSDVDLDGGGAQGCMSMGDDPECPVIFEHLGLGDAAQDFVVVD